MTDAVFDLPSSKYLVAFKGGNKMAKVLVAVTQLHQHDNMVICGYVTLGAFGHPSHPFEKNTMSVDPAMVININKMINICLFK
jgi:hypothetical protein